MKIKMQAKNFDKLKGKIKKDIERIIHSSKFMNEVGKEVVFDIQRSARTGKTIEKDGSSKRMEPLAPLTIKRREYLERGGNATANPYRTMFSNLSMSGQLIDSIKYLIEGKAIKIFAFGIRKNYYKLSGKRMRPKRTVTNQELLIIHQNGSPENNLPPRPILGLRTQMQNRIMIKLKEYLRRQK